MAHGDRDPPRHERQYFVHTGTGDFGWKVWRNGVEHIKYDRPGTDHVVKYRSAEWKERTERRPMSPAQLAQVAFEADRVLCERLQLFDKAKKSWTGLEARERAAWIERGPKGHPDREALYQAIWSTLKHLVD